MNASRASLLAAAVVVTAAAPAEAKPHGRVDVSTVVSATRLEVGEVLKVTLRVKGDRASIGSPSLSAPPEFQPLGSSSVQHTYLDVNTRRMSTGIDVTWDYRAMKAGHFSIPGPTATVNGKAVRSDGAKIEVVAASGRQPGTNPFIPPGMSGAPQGFPFPWPFGSDDVLPEEEPDVPQRTDLDMKEEAPDPRAFVRAIVDKTNVVVGQQVNVRYYLYHTNAALRTEDSKTPSFAMFRRVPFDRDPGERVGIATVHGEKFMTELCDRSALFPLHAGDLQVGAFQLKVFGRRISPAGELRVSNQPTIHVTEPPLAGRPPGYAIGDVGVYTLAATVSPNKIKAGGAVTVSLRLAGTGLVPDSVHVPESDGALWLEPEKKEHIEIQNGRVTGARTFGYVVKLKNPGSVDLGSVELPYWDPTAKKYAVAKAALGVVEVTGSVEPPPEEPMATKPPDDLMSTLPAARKELSPWVEPRASTALAGPRFWSLLALGPLGLALITAAERGRRGLAKRKAAGAASPRAAAERALAQADEAKTARDVASAIERAVHAASEAAFGVKTRGLLLGEIPEALAQAGAAPEVGEKARELLAASDAIRFEPGDADDGAARAHVKAARELVATMLRGQAK